MSPSLSWLGAGYKQPLAGPAGAAAVAALVFPGCVFLCLNRFAAPGQRGPCCATLGMRSHMVGAALGNANGKQTWKGTMLEVEARGGGVVLPFQTWKSTFSL